MEPTSQAIIASAERVFDRSGFAGSSVDDLARAAGVSTRTLYKHLGGKAGLVAAVLDERRTRFVRSIDPSSVAALFGGLHGWIEAEGARGCLFLRASGDRGAEGPEAAEAIRVYRAELVDLVTRACDADGSPGLVDQVLVLFEGATSAATYRGVAAVDAARTVAEVLVGNASRGAA